MRYRIEVYIRRNDQPCYTYTSQAKVKRSKISDIIDETAKDIAAHEGRSGMTTSVTTYATGAIVRVYGNETSARFIVKAWRVR